MNAIKVYNALSLKWLGIDTYKESVIYMQRDCLFDHVSSCNTTSFLAHLLRKITPSILLLFHFTRLFSYTIVRYDFLRVQFSMLELPDEGFS